MTRIISVVQQKGGSGKTTSASSISSILASYDKKVLLCDGDSQGNIADSYGINKLDLPFTMYELLLEKCQTADAIVKAPLPDRPSLDILPSNLLLAGVDLEVGGELSREFLLKMALDQIRHQYDYILIDCGPHLSLVTINAMAASNEVLIPVETSYLCIQGLSMLLRTYNKVKQRLNPGLVISGAFFTKVDHTRDSKEVMEDMINEFQRLGIHLFDTKIRRNIKLQEAPRSGVPIDLVSPLSAGADDYRSLTAEIIAQEGVWEVKTS